MKLRLNKTKLLIFFALAVLLTYLMVRIYHLGGMTSIQSQQQANCSTFPVNAGPEDLEIDETTKFLYFISNDRCFSDDPAGTTGHVYRLQIDRSVTTPEVITPKNPDIFHPQGISLYREDSMLYLFAINHRTLNKHTIEIFRVTDSGKLIHRETIESETLIWPNDIAAISKRHFFITDVNRPLNSFMRKIDALFSIEVGKLLFYNGEKMHTVDKDLYFPNGVVADFENKRLYVTESLAGALRKYSLDANFSPALETVQSIAPGLDNINLNAKKDLVIALQPDLIKLGNHLNDPDKRSPGKIIMVEGGLKKTLVQNLYATDGQQISGMSSAAFHEGRLYAGAVCEPRLLYCNISNGEISLADNLMEWKKAGKYLKVDEHEIFLREEGTGEHILLLHAFPTASWGWHKMWPWLKEKYHLIAPDLPGSGFSDKPPGDHYSILHLADVIEKLLKKQGVRRFHILAHAYGVSVAQELLARQQSNTDYDFDIRSVCFISGGIFPDETKTTFMQKILLTPAGKLITNIFPTPEKIFYNRLKQQFGIFTQPENEEMQEYWQLLTFNHGEKRVSEVIKYLQERHQHKTRWVSSMRESTIPLCFINGTTDKLTGATMNKRWKSLLPDAAFFKINEPIGHFAPLEIPEKLSSYYLKFMNASDPRAAASEVEGRP